jgi:lytic murein transglycosylase
MKIKVITAVLLLSLGAVQAQNTSPTLDPVAYQNCLSQLRGSGLFTGISAATWAQAAPQLQPDGSVLPLLDKQPEFTMPVWDYMAVLVDAERVRDGKAAYKAWRDVLQTMGQRYGVSPYLVAGVWGVESNFGQNLGGRPLVTSLATLSCFGRRQAYFRGEFANTLRILQNGDVALAQLNGSWAGAFGQTQFMPSTFLRLAQDGDGDGHKDIVGSVPDALASTANFLAKAGFRQGQPWGYEVRVPSGYQGPSGRKNKKAINYWRSQGLTLANGSALPDDMVEAGLLQPAGARGPAFLVGKNFDTLYSYNASENYALAIAHLSDLIGQGGSSTNTGFVQPWPTDDPGLSRAQNRELQALLLAKGYDIGAADGMIGAKTREAIKIEATKLGLPTTGRAGQKLLAALKK